MAITRPTDTDDVSDATVLNDIIEEWEDLDKERNDVSFPEALRAHYTELLELLSEDDSDPKLAEDLRSEVGIIEGWLAEFSEMHSKLTGV